jgi:hypothetical protein
MPTGLRERNHSIMTTPTPPAAQPTASQPTEPQESKTYTPDDVERIVRDRLDRDRKQRPDD